MPNTNTAIGDYSKEFTKRVENSLLDIWGRLGEYRDYLVLIGGLAPRYITAPQGTLDYTLSSHCGTMDIDFGISLAIADVEKYKAISGILKDSGFDNAINENGRKQRHSFVKGSGENSVIIDFLTTKYEGPDNSLMHTVVPEISAIQTKGLGLALREPRKYTIEGENDNGEHVQEIINVCRPAAYVVLKSLAFDSRRKDKDVYDLIFVLNNYKNGVGSVVEEITNEDCQASSFHDAMECLKRHFKGIGYVGSIAYERFVGESNARARAFAIVQEFLDKVGKKYTNA